MIDLDVKVKESLCLRELFESKKREEREKGRNWGQKDIANLGGWTQPNVSSYLSGKVELKEDSAHIFAKAFGVPISIFSPRLAEKIKQREAYLKNPDLDDSEVTYVPKYDINSLGDLNFFDKNNEMPMTKNIVPITGKYSEKVFSLDLLDASLDGVYSWGTTFVFDPILKPKPTDIVLVKNKMEPDEYLIRAYKVIEIKENGTEIFELYGFNSAFPTLKFNYEVLAVAVLAQNKLR